MAWQWFAVLVSLPDGVMVWQWFAALVSLPDEFIVVQ